MRDVYILGMINAPTARDFRAAIARERLRIFHLAALVDVHPSRLSLVLNERRPLTPELAERLTAAIAHETAAKK